VRPNLLTTHELAAEPRATQSSSTSATPAGSPDITCPTPRSGVNSAERSQREFIHRRQRAGARCRWSTRDSRPCAPRVREGVRPWRRPHEPEEGSTNASGPTARAVLLFDIARPSEHCARLRWRDCFWADALVGHRPRIAGPGRFLRRHKQHMATKDGPVAVADRASNARPCFVRPDDQCSLPQLAPGARLRGTDSGQSGPSSASAPCWRRRAVQRERQANAGPGQCRSSLEVKRRRR
jgi:hypothetical protein